MSSVPSKTVCILLSHTLTLLLCQHRAGGEHFSYSRFASRWCCAVYCMHTKSHLTQFHISVKKLSSAPVSSEIHRPMLSSSGGMWQTHTETFGSYLLEQWSKINDYKTLVFFWVRPSMKCNQCETIKVSCFVYSNSPVLEKLITHKIKWVVILFKLQKLQ